MQAVFPQIWKMPARNLYSGMSIANCRCGYLRGGENDIQYDDNYIDKSRNFSGLWMNMWTKENLSKLCDVIR